MTNSCDRQLFTFTQAVIFHNSFVSASSTCHQFLLKTNVSEEHNTQQSQMSSLDHKMFETLYIHFVLDNLVSHKQRTWHRDRIHHVDMQSVGLKENLCSPARVTGYILLTLGAHAQRGLLSVRSSVSCVCTVCPFSKISLIVPQTIRLT